MQRHTAITRRPHRSARSRIAATAVAALIATAVAGVGAPTPASAAAASDLATLQSAVHGACTPGDTVTLSADISAPTADVLVTCDDLVLDLAGHDLSLQTLKLTESGVTFTITDSTALKADAGTLVADADSLDNGITNSEGSSLTISGTANVEATGYNGAAGIGGGGRDDDGTFAGPRNGGDITITDQATVTATGGTQAAAIGGGAGGGETGDVVISSSATVTAHSGLQGTGIGSGSIADQGGTITITDAAMVTVYARSGGGAAIGGGAGGDAGRVDVSGAAQVTAVGSGTGAAIGGGGNGATLTISGTSTVTIGGNGHIGAGFNGDDFGSVTVTDTATLRLPTGETETLDSNTASGAAGAEIVVGPNARIVGSDGVTPTFGQITGDGQIHNAGVITLPGGNVAVDVFDHNYQVTFDNGASDDADPAGSRIFAESFTAGTRTFPSDPTPPLGATFLGWNTSDDGTGTMVTSGTILTGASADGAFVDVPLFARYALGDPNLTISGTPKVGETLTATIDPQAPSTTVAYQWQVVDTGTGTGTDIPGAQSATYVPVAGQTGEVLRVRVTLTADGGDRTETADTAVIGKGDQTISFTSTAPIDAALGGDDYTVTATGGGSGNPVTFAIAAASSSICSITGSTVSFDSTGTCTIEANQAGNADYNAAPQNTQDVTVAKGDQTITFTTTPPSNGVVGGPGYTVAATGGASGNPVTFAIASASSAVCTITGSTVSFDSTGTCTIEADQAGNADYDAAPQATQDITVRTAGVIVTVVDSTTSEGDAADTAVVQFSLTALPSGAVTIPISVDTTEGATATQITIEPGDWDDPAANELTIIGVDDDFVDGDIVYAMVTGDPSSTDTAFDALVGTDVDDVGIANADDDLAGIVFDVTDDTVTDSGGTATIEVSLTARPTGAVTIPITASDPTEATTVSSITIQPADWNTPAANVITVTGVADGTRDGDQTITVAIGDPTSVDPAFDALDDTAVSPAAITSIDTDRLADIGIESNGELTLAAGGTQADLGFTVVNSGGDDAHDVTVDVTLPTGVTLSSAGASTLSAVAGCTATPTGATCDLGTVAAGDSVDVTITVDAPDPAATPATLTASATLSTATPDADTADDTVDGTIHLTAVADLTMITTPLPTGTDTTSGFEVTLTNTGPSNSANTTITFALPTGVSLADVPQDCTISGQTVTCDLDLIAPGGANTLTFHLTGTTGTTTIELSATSDADGPTTHTVTVPANQAPTTTTPPTTTPATTPTSVNPPTTDLPATGGQAPGHLLPMAAVLLLAGLAATMASRRKHIARVVRTN